jgi:hypothetical protein
MSFAKKRAEEQGMAVAVIQKSVEPRNSQIFLQKKQVKGNQNSVINGNSFLPLQSKINNQDDCFKSIKFDRYSPNKKCKSALIHDFQG